MILKSHSNNTYFDNTYSVYKKTKVKKTANEIKVSLTLQPSKLQEV